MKLIAIGNRGIYSKLTAGKEYEILREERILNRQYITVVANDGKEFTCHKERFCTQEEWDNMYREIIKSQFELPGGRK